MSKNSRTFYLFVDPTLLPYTMDPVKKKGFTDIKTSQGYHVSYPLAREINRDKISKSVQVLDNKIKAAVYRESRYLIVYWQSHVRSHFNRTNTRGIAKIKRRINRGSCLRRALVIENINSFGSRLYVTACMKQNVDYVNVLIDGAGPTMGNHYVPEYNARLKGGVWHGIPPTYWSIWQANFRVQVKLAQARLNKEVERIIDAFKLSTYANALYGANMGVDSNTAKRKENTKYKIASIDQTNNAAFNDNSNYSKFFKGDAETTKTTKKVQVIRKLW